jgi:hypothetical protein
LNTQLKLSRRLAVATAASAFFWPRKAHATALPVDLQVDLLVKVAAYDRNLRARAGDEVRVLLVRGNDDASGHWAEQASNALKPIERIAGLPHSESTIVYRNAMELAQVCRSRRITIALLSRESALDAEHIGGALDGVSVLTAAPDAEMVKRGIVLGFELMFGKPKLFLNLPQAKRQDVALSSAVLKLMTVYQ